MDYTTHVGQNAEQAELSVAFVFVNDPLGKFDTDKQNVGGFDTYMEYGKRTLLVVPAMTNTLSLARRDKGVVQVVKYLASNAPSSRVDVVASYGIDA
eukprot:gnl/MRDRNA2_/MRDRNA2_276967_c0_seq1.p1 gnl/MRDRNA2_/MRDRNA2_276967_c0~~gnl/MRDRNA2_/MRDRNA2_276967_c0_seq1.p1  ORF type:complete len:107 (+),score=20.90 gnl/MRDRNA2_/MRDRNA2_276967_c0_seq1:32-322(+)